MEIIPNPFITHSVPLPDDAKARFRTPTTRGGWLAARSPPSPSCCTVRSGTRGWSGRPGPRAAAAVLAARVLPSATTRGGWLAARSPRSPSCCTVRSGTRGWSGRPDPRAAAAVLAARVLPSAGSGCRSRRRQVRAMSCRTARLRPAPRAWGIVQSACAPAPHRASLPALIDPCQRVRPHPGRRLRGRLRPRQNWRACARASAMGVMQRSSNQPRSVSPTWCTQARMRCRLACATLIYAARMRRLPTSQVAWRSRPLRAGARAQR
jgi:hypothetical protein